MRIDVDGVAAWWPRSGLEHRRVRFDSQGHYSVGVNRNDGGSTRRNDPAPGRNWTAGASYRF